MSQAGTAEASGGSEGTPGLAANKEKEAAKEVD